ncbi:MAG: hypothetical protein DRQ61_07565 [Gammaproteobacteria bacterium]|nr:MAG: hypothetical protein DRQ56_08685 [Gammaproteobacteria bacterium]RLA21937.1 MAG: hypothetical protein DRQ61_07565 [Gammaproteobacteria bacterium]
MLLSGCASLSNLGHEPLTEKYEPTTLEQLQHFFGEYAQKPPKDRSIVCGELFQKEEIENNLLHKLKLSYAIAVTPGCGSTSEAIALIEDAHKITNDEQLIKVIDYQTLLLKRLRGVSRYALNLKSRASKSQEKATVLELKLEAIKSIEKALNRRD